MTHYHQPNEDDIVQSTGLPFGIQTTLDEAVLRTGMTDALRLAVQRVSYLLDLTVSEVETMFMTVQEKDTLQNYVDMDVTVLYSGSVPNDSLT